MQRFTVGIGVNRHRFNVELAACARDPDGDLAPVSDENAFEHANT
jgi:hypothetical protein